MAGMNPRRVGDITEVQAAAWLMQQGFEVFRNISGTGPVDMVAVRRTGEVILVDVKSFCGGSLTDLQKEMGVKLLIQNANDSFRWHIPMSVRTSLDRFVD